MSMHEIEYLVEATVRQLDTGTSDSALDLRTLFWNLYDYQANYDTGNTLFRVVAILARHRYMYYFPVEAHPDFAKYPKYFASLKKKDFEDICSNPSKQWARRTNPVAGYYCDPVRAWGADFCGEEEWGDLAKPLLWCEAGSPLWECWVANGTLTGADAKRPAKLDRTEFFLMLMQELVRRQNRELAAEWYQMGMVYELGDPRGKALKALQKNTALLAIRKLAAAHELHTVPVERGFMDFGEAGGDTFLAWWQKPTLA